MVAGLVPPKIFRGGKDRIDDEVAGMIRLKNVNAGPVFNNIVKFIPERPVDLFKLPVWISPSPPACTAQKA